MKKIIIYGAGGHAKVILDIINSRNEYTAACYFDDQPQVTSIDGVPVFSSKDELLSYSKKNDIESVVIAIGNNSARKKIFQEMKSLGFQLPTLIHSSANLSKKVTLGEGTVVMPGVIINAATTVKDGVILNTGCIVEHDCIIEDFVHIAPGSVLCGGVKVGALTMVGSRSVIIPLKKVGSGTTIGAGSVVVRDIDDNVCAYGNPARCKTS